MRIFTYDELRKFSYDDVLKVSASPEPFKIIIDDRRGRRVARFLECESAFRASHKSLFDRLKFFGGAMNGMWALDFMPVWNRAIMDGFAVERIQRTSQGYEFVFLYRSCR